MACEGLWLVACVVPLVLLSLLTPRTQSITAEIYPTEAFFVKGTDAILDCVITDYSHNDTFSAEDIIWFKDFMDLPSTNFIAVNDSVSQLTISNSTFDDSGNYGCMFQGENLYFDAEIQRVWIGLPPSPVLNLTCWSYTGYGYECSWLLGEVTNINTVDTMYYGPQKNYECAIDSGHPNSCSIASSDMNAYGNQKIQVVRTNALNSSSSEINFNSETDAVPYPPVDLTVSPDGHPPGSTHLYVTWNKPPEWQFQSEYRLHYRSQHKNTWMKAELVSVNFRTYNLTGLYPNTKYYVRVAAKRMQSTGEKSWSEWTKVEDGRTVAAAPVGTVSNVFVQKNISNMDNPQYQRDVTFSWQPVPIEKQGANSILYRAELRNKGTKERRSENITSPRVTFTGVDKYDRHSLTVTPINTEGAGADVVMDNILEDLTAVPSKVQNLSAAIDSETGKLRINWNRPAEPNGYIYKYKINAYLQEENILMVTRLRPDSKVDPEAWWEEPINCSKVTRTSDGYPVTVRVVAYNLDGSDKVLGGPEEVVEADGNACIKEPNLGLLLGFVIPSVIILSIVVGCSLFHLFKDFRKEPPEIYFPDKVIKNGVVAVLPRSHRYTLEPEPFDFPKSKQDTDVHSRNGDHPPPYTQQGRPSLIGDGEQFMTRTISTDSALPPSPHLLEEQGLVWGTEFQDNFAFENDGYRRTTRSDSGGGNSIFSGEMSGSFQIHIGGVDLSQSSSDNNSSPGYSQMSEAPISPSPSTYSDMSASSTTFLIGQQTSKGISTNSIPQSYERMAVDNSDVPGNDGYLSHMKTSEDYLPDSTITNRSNVSLNDKCDKAPQSVSNQVNSGYLPNSVHPRFLPKSQPSLTINTKGVNDNMSSLQVNQGYVTNTQETHGLKKEPVSPAPYSQMGANDNFVPPGSGYAASELPEIDSPYVKHGAASVVNSGYIPDDVASFRLPKTTFPVSNSDHVHSNASPGTDITNNQPNGSLSLSTDGVGNEYETSNSSPYSQMSREGSTTNVISSPQSGYVPHSYLIEQADSKNTIPPYTQLGTAAPSTSPSSQHSTPDGGYLSHAPPILGVTTQPNPPSDSMVDPYVMVSQTQ